MATMSRSETRRLYSWWWDSHIPKNSKWLQENLTDMDSKVKQMIKLIEEDADSFARRAEMYYKKRPELMKLVEEFYRAYRALAERYDHATVELRQAHRTMSQAFPNQVPFNMDDDSPYSSSGPDTEPHTPDALHKNHGFQDSSFLHKEAAGLSPTGMHAVMKDGRKRTSRRGFKQFQEMFESGEEALNTQLESTDDVNAGMEVQTLKNTLAKIQAEKEAVLSQYTVTLEKLSDLEKELRTAQDNTRGLDEQASRAETEVKELKEALEKLKAERDAALYKHNQCMERLSSLENLISEIQMDGRGLNERATKAESEAQYLKEELSKMEADKEAALLKYNQSLEKISALENKILFMEKEAGMLRGQIERAESEVTEMTQVVSILTKEKEDVALQYKKCLETIAEMAAEITCAHEEAIQLRNEIQSSAAKLVSAEEQCVSLERSNHTLQEEADKLAHEIETKDEELSIKQEELDKLKGLLQDEHSRFVQVEATLNNLQQLHSQSQEAQRALALELKDVLQVLKDLEACKHNLEEEMQLVKDENQSLTKQNLSSSFSLNNLQNEISNLKALKEKLEQELVVQAEHTNALQQEISSLKEEIEGLNMRYQALILQVESAGLKPECIASSLKKLQDEKLQLKDTCEKETRDREVLAEQLKNMDKVLEKSALMESSMSELNNMLQVSRERIQELQESCQMLQGDKSNLVAEKATLLSQLQIMTETMQKLLEKNTVLESSLSGANIELEGLRTKSKSLEEYCQLLSNEKSSLLTERSILVSQLDGVEQRLGSLERRFTKLEETYDGLEKEKRDTLRQVEEVRGSISVEKEEHASYVQSTETRMTGLERIIQILQEENRSKKTDVDQEIDKAVNAQVEIFILQKFIQDLEEKNSSLFTECQKHIEASKTSDKLISELEGENLAQQMEAEFLLDEIEKLRMGIHQVFTALRIDPVAKLKDDFLADEIPLQCILNNIEDIKSSLHRYKDDSHQLLVEKSVLSSDLEQLRLDSADLRSANKTLEKELKMMTERQEVLQKDTLHLMDTNDQLRSDVNRGEQQEAALENEVENLHVKLVNLQQSYVALQDENCKTLEDNRSIVNKLSNVNQEKYALQEEFNAIVQEANTQSNISMVLEIFGTEKAAELKALAKDHNSLQTRNSDLRNELKELERRLKIEEAENLHLKRSAESFDRKLHNITDMKGQLDVQIMVAEDFLREKEIELSEAKQKLSTTQQLNLELSRDFEELKKQYKESQSIKDDLEKNILVISNDNCIKTKEVERLREKNESLESEVGRLEKEIEHHVVREDNLCLELQEKNNEFALWDAEATSFYFDSQISSVREALLENKLYELNGMYENLKDENCDKSLEIEQMKGRIDLLESEIGGMRAQMSTYGSVIDSLRDDVASLENNAFHMTKLQLAGDHSQQDAEATDPESSLQLQADQSVLPDRISELLKVQIRIRAVGKAMIDQMERVAKHNGGSARFKLKAAVEKSEEPPQSQLRAYRDVHREEKEGAANGVLDTIKQKNKPELLEVKNGTLMKDIPLDQVSRRSFHGVSRSRHGRVDDQMLELWETVERDPTVDKAHNPEFVPMRGNDPYRPRNSRHKSNVPSMELQVEKELSVDKLELSSSAREPNQEGKRKILERLASDAQKITRLQTKMKELRKRMDMLKRVKKTKNVEYETVKTRLQEYEETIMRITNINDDLTKNLDGSPLSWDGRTSEDFEEARNVRRRRATEQARKESDKIGQLQFDLQNIQDLLLKLEDENKGKGKGIFSGSRTGILLKDFISSGKRVGRRKKKVRFCGCMRTSSNRSLSSQLQ